MEPELEPPFLGGSGAGARAEPRWEPTYYQSEPRFGADFFIGRSRLFKAAPAVSFRKAKTKCLVLVPNKYEFSLIYKDKYDPALVYIHLRIGGNK